jgi:hypothetical protein
MMGLQEIIVLTFVVLAVVYVGYRVSKSYSGKPGDGECDKCGANPLNPDKKKGS